MTNDLVEVIKTKHQILNLPDVLWEPEAHKYSVYEGKASVNTLRLMYTKENLNIS